ncbi:DUF1656 domain-containing protein [Methylobacterium sp. JK268]
MVRDLALGGVLVAPFVAYAAGALLLLLGLRPILRLIRFERVFANPPLAEAGLYLCLLALLIVII